MLVLSRKVGESVRIGNDVTVTVVRIGPNSVRLGITAPHEMNIARQEIDLHFETEPVAIECGSCRESMLECFCVCTDA